MHDCEALGRWGGITHCGPVWVSTMVMGRCRCRCDVVSAQGSFDLSLLSDFRERPLTETLLVERVLPLVSCPSRLIVTTDALYLQPVPLNDIGS